jgi:hypothetical protein
MSVAMRSLQFVQVAAGAQVAQTQGLGAGQVGQETQVGQQASQAPQVGQGSETQVGQQASQAPQVGQASQVGQGAASVLSLL